MSPRVYRGLQVSIAIVTGASLAASAAAFIDARSEPAEILDPLLEAASADASEIDFAVATTQSELAAVGHTTSLGIAADPSEFFTYPVTAVRCLDDGNETLLAATNLSAQAQVAAASSREAPIASAVSKTEATVISRRGTVSCAVFVDLSEALASLEIPTELVPPDPGPPAEVAATLEAGNHVVRTEPATGNRLALSTWATTPRGLVLSQTSTVAAATSRTTLVAGLLLGLGLLGFVLLGLCTVQARRRVAARALDAAFLQAATEFSQEAATAVRPEDILRALQKALRRGVPSGGDWRVARTGDRDGEEEEAEDRSAVSDALVHRALALDEASSSEGVALPSVQGLPGIAPGRILFVLRDADGPRAVVIGSDKAVGAEFRANLLFRMALASLLRVSLMGMLVSSERHASVGKLAAGVAHEINNPLAYTVANLRSLYAGADRVDQSVLRDALEGCERIEHIVRSLRVLFHGPEELVFEPVLIADLATRTANMARAHRPGIPIEITRDDDVWVNGDPVGLGQILLNLMTNALDAVRGASDPKVRVHVSVRDGEAVVEVTDNGAGVDPVVQERIFEAFVTTKGRRGTGLGLGISRSFALAHDGTLELAKTGPEGTTFRLIVPAHAGPSRAVSGVEPSALASIPPGARRPRVLFVDDEVALLRAVKRWLARAADVTTTSNPNEGLAMAIEGNFDRILCDLNMPHMSGLDFVAHLREHAPEVVDRVVIATGSIDARLGDIPLITKPLHAEELLALLEPREGDPSSGERNVG